MKSKSTQYVISALVIALVVAGIAYGATRPNSEELAMKAEQDAAMMQEKELAMKAEQDTAMMQKEDAMKKDGDAMMAASKGKFVTYAPSLVAEASKENKTVLFFNASWCPTCKAATASLKSAGVPDGVTVLSVDYDTNQALRTKYGVTYQHTFVQVDATGNQLAKWSGSASGAEIAAKAI